jgi:hypothetical protein|eukprot:COSAG06_NODE_35419_length_460_cov_0.961219_1_plen_32_part_10
MYNMAQQGAFSAPAGAVIAISPGIGAVTVMPS